MPQSTGCRCDASGISGRFFEEGCTRGARAPRSPRLPDQARGPAFARRQGRQSENSALQVKGVLPAGKPTGPATGSPSPRSAKAHTDAAQQHPPLRRETLEVNRVSY